LYFYRSGDVRHYSFTLVSKSKIAIDITGGEDIVLVVNPGYSSSSPSEFDVSARYRWILKDRLGSFDIGSFDYSPEAFLDIIIKVFGIDTASILQSAIYAFFHESDYDEDSDPLQHFVEVFNEYFSPATDLTVPSHDNLNEIIEDLIAQMATGGNDPFAVIFSLYIDAGATLEEKLANIETLFREYFGGFTLDSFKQILLPQFSVSFHDLNIALEFPRNILQPINEQTGEVEEDEEIKTRLTCDLGSLTFDSDVGFSFNAVLSMALDKSEILGTGFILEATGIKIDLSDSSNIPEADAEDRPSSFKGIYIEEATIGLPKDWTNNSDVGVEIKGKELLIGTEGGFSGKIGVEGNGNLKFSLLGIEIDFTSFYVEFKQNQVLSSDIKGKLTIPGLQDSTGEDAKLDFVIDWNKDGYSIEFKNTNGIQLKVPNVVDITLYSLSIGRINGKWEFKSKGKIDRVRDIPVIGAIIPRTIDFKQFEINQGAANDYNIDIKWENDVTANFSKNGLSVDEEHTFPINKTFLKIFTLHLMKLQVKSNDQNGVDIQALADADLELKPIFAKARGGGLKAEISFPENGGNLGPVDIRFSFVTPTSMGIKIKIPGIEGQGYLDKDLAEEKYSGMLHLEIQDKLKITALGILNLKLPSGKAGFSIIGIATVEFDPAIDITAGLKLSGIGALFGLNRSMDISALLSSLRNDTLQHLMFPKDPEKNAPTIISTMGSVFPVHEGQFTFGLLLKAYWGGEKLVQLKLGVLVEVPDPVKIVIAGILQINLPDEANPLIKINASFLAAVDFEAKKFALDARIYDSKIMNISISGDILARYYWGENSGFMLSIGGFHPSYTPQKMDLPAKINRLALSFIDEPGKSLKGVFYMAVTSNSVQFGAVLDLYVGIALGYNLKANFSLDVLIYTKPQFSFIAEMHISAGVYKGSKNKPAAGISISMSLQGPNPYHAKGRGSVSIGPIEVSADFDLKLSNEKPISASSVNVFALLTAQLQNNYTWQTILSAVNVNMREADLSESGGNTLLLHPMGRLQVKQGIVPLNIPIKCFGNSTVEGDDKMWIQSAKIGQTTLITAPTKDKFAPDQFFNISDSEKLTSPSFNDYEDGVEIGGVDVIESSCVRIKEAGHDPVIIDREFTYPRPFETLDVNRQNDLLSGGVVAGSPVAGKNPAHNFIGEEQQVSSAQDGFTLLFAEDNTEVAAELTFLTYEDAISSLQAYALDLDLFENEIIIEQRSIIVTS